MASCMALTACVSSGRAARISTVVPSVSSAYTLAPAVTGVMLIAASQGRPAGRSEQRARDGDVPGWFGVAEPVTHGDHAFEMAHRADDVVPERGGFRCSLPASRCRP